MHTWALQETLQKGELATTLLQELLKADILWTPSTTTLGGLPQSLLLLTFLPLHPGSWMVLGRLPQTWLYSKMSIQLMSNSYNSIMPKCWALSSTHCLCLYLFPIAPLTNYHEQWLRTTQMYYPTQASVTWKKGVGRAVFLSKGSGENLCPCCSQLLQAICTACIMVPFRQLQSQPWQVKPHPYF